MLKVIENTSLITGSQPNSFSNYLESIKNNPVCSGIKIGNSVVTSHRVKSIIAVGIDINGDKKQITPKLIDLNAEKFSKFLETATYEEYRPNIKFYLPLPGNTPSVTFTQKRELPAINISESELTQLNPAFSKNSHFPYFGASSSVSAVPADIGSHNCWSSQDKHLSGHVYGKYKDVSFVPELVALIYSQSIVDEIQSRYGYRCFNPTRHYFHENWLKLSTGSGFRYYRLMFLTEFDHGIHYGVLSDSSRLTQELVLSKPFEKMILDMIMVDENNNANSEQYEPSHTQFQNLMFRTMFSKNDIMISGQFMYSKCYRYKLHLRYNGKCNVYKLPITSSSLESYERTLGTFKIWSQASDNHISCVLKDDQVKGLCIYVNPKYIIKTTTDNSVNIDIDNQTEIISSVKDVVASSALTLDNDYKLIVLPGGSLFAGSWGNGNNTDLVANVSMDERNIGLNLQKHNGSKYDPKCQHYWKMKDSKFGDKIIIDVMPGSDTCYVNPVLTPYTLIKDANGNPDISQLNLGLQAISYLDGANVDDIVDILKFPYQFFNSITMETIKSLGLNINEDIKNWTTVNHCMRGGNWLTDSNCKYNNTSFAKHRELIDYDIKTRICNGFPNKTAEEINFCNQYNSGVTTTTTTIPVQSPEQEFLLQHDKLLNNPNELSKWKSQYITTNNLSIDTISSNITNKDIQYLLSYVQNNLVYVERFYPVIVQFKTEAGIFIGGSLLSFPYNTSISSYDPNDKFWKVIVAASYALGPYDTEIGKMHCWNGPSFTNLTETEAKNNLLKSPSYYSSIFNKSIYDTIILKAGPYPVYVYMINLNSIVPYMNTIRNSNDSIPNFLIDSKNNEICKNEPNACYPEVSYYIQNTPFDDKVNEWCDIAVNSSNNYNSDSNFNQANATDLLSKCNASYAAKYCSNPDNRYKSNFVSKSNRRSYSSKPPSTIFEMFTEPFSGDVSCVDLCDMDNVSNTVKTACETGAIEYCSQGDNIIGAICQSDINKYSNMNTILSQWCSDNPSHPDHASYCPSKDFAITVTQQSEGEQNTNSSVSAQAGSAVFTMPITDDSTTKKSDSDVLATTESETIEQNISNDNNKYVDEHSSSENVDDSGMPLWGWILIIIGVLLISIGIGYVVYKKIYKKKKRTSVYKSNTFNPFDIVEDEPMKLEHVYNANRNESSRLTSQYNKNDFML